MEVLSLKKHNGLYAPDGFWRLKPEDRKRICNGAGSRGFGWAVPDTFYGVSVRRAADIHDYCYFMKLDKEFSDRLFYTNMKILIKQATDKKPWYIRIWNPLRHLRALNYYYAVDLFGGFAYD